MVGQLRERRGQVVRCRQSRPGEQVEVEGPADDGAGACHGDRGVGPSGLEPSEDRVLDRLGTSAVGRTSARRPRRPPQTARAPRRGGGCRPFARGRPRRRHGRPAGRTRRAALSSSPCRPPSNGRGGPPRRGAGRAVAPASRASGLAGTARRSGTSRRRAGVRRCAGPAPRGSRASGRRPVEVLERERPGRSRAERGQDLGDVEDEQPAASMRIGVTRSAAGRRVVQAPVGRDATAARRRLSRCIGARQVDEDRGRPPGGRSGTSPPRTVRKPAARARRSIAPSSRVLPTPASPASRRKRPLPAATSAIRRSASSSRSSRPTRTGQTSGRRSSTPEV